MTQKANSNSFMPDLDWTQVRETSKLLTLSAGQVEDLMSASDVSVNTLTDSFTSIVEHMQTIYNHLQDFEDSPARTDAMRCCTETSDRIQESIIAFQFYDRMQQCLSHVTSNLKGLSALVESPERLYNPFEWHKFQMEIRSHYTMESEKIMFDAILAGKSVEEALAIKEAIEAQHQSEEDDIELF
jgi:NifU-like protein involved in Fe-S cluster formation